jgi:multidrug resistance protein MdtO
MAAAATFFPADRRGFFDWFADFLRNELAPYPGRSMVVARMVISATLTMILIMTWRIPGGAIGPLYAFLISRENLGSTAKSGLTIVIAFGLGALFIPIGAPMFASMPLTHFLWEAFSIFLIFFLIHTLSDFGVAGGLGLMSTAALAIWYLPGPPEANVERTLWQVVSPAIGAVVTLAVEAVFHAFHHRDELIEALDGRLAAVESLLRSEAEGSPLPRDVRHRLTQYAMVGSGRLRRMIARSSFDRTSRTNSSSAQMVAVVALTGRTVDFAAAMILAYPELSATDRQIAANVAEQIAEVRSALDEGRRPRNLQAGRIVSGLPLLREMEGMVGLIPRVFEGSLALDAFQVPPQVSGVETPLWNRVFVRDAFTNPEHVRYALTGCLAGMLCYILYVGLAWPSLSTAVTTCVLTALTSIGTSRQKQFLRLSGAVLGGFIFGMGAQIFILPYIDSITGFTLLFAAVTAIAAWVATASTRLSYCGLQIALAFYFVHVNDFTIQTSLSIARDRVLGVLLGIIMMWLVFERFHPKTAAAQMVETFNSNLHLLAELSQIDAEIADPKAVGTARALRDKIYANFSAVNAQADAVPFEIGSGRMRHMAARERIRRWQAMLRTLYLLQLALLQARIFGTAAPPTADERAALVDFDRACAQVLQEMAAYLEAQYKEELPEDPGPIEHLLVLGGEAEAPSGSLLELGREMGKILERMRDEILAAPLYSVE